MAAPKNNKNALGNKGGGRKSAYQEFASAKKLFAAFETGINIESLQAMIKKIEGGKGKVNLVEFSLYRALKNDKVLMGLLDKVMPTKTLLGGDGDNGEIVFNFVKYGGDTDSVQLRSKAVSDTVLSGISKKRGK